MNQNVDIQRGIYAFEGTDCFQSKFQQRKAGKLGRFSYFHLWSVNEHVLSKVELQSCSAGSVEVALVAGLSSGEFCVRLIAKDLQSAERLTAGRLGNLPLRHVVGYQPGQIYVGWPGRTIKQNKTKWFWASQAIKLGILGLCQRLHVRVPICLMLSDVEF